MLTSKQIAEKLGLKYTRTLSRWHSIYKLIPSPVLKTHPNGRGKISYWDKKYLPLIEYVHKKLNIVDGEERDVYKSPSSDPSKNSKRGRLALLYSKKENRYSIVKSDKGWSVNDILQTVFENGDIVVEHTFDEIKERARII